MKALCIRSPWWEKILSGEKTIETRTWYTKYRGPLAVCASQPKGAIVGVAQLVDVRPLTVADAAAACCPYKGNTYAWVLEGATATIEIPIRGRLGLFDIDISTELRAAANPVPTDDEHFQNE